MLEIKERYQNLKAMFMESNDPRVDDFKTLMQYLETETPYLVSPASNRYHLSVPGGLLIHSVLVTETLIRIKKLLAPEISNESCILVGLLHDCGKSIQYRKKEPTEKQKAAGYPAWPPYEVRDDIVFMDHQIRSLYYIGTMIALTEEEWAAIAYHNEPWDGQRTAFRKNKLQTLLQDADYWSANYLEGNEGTIE